MGQQHKLSLMIFLCSLTPPPTHTVGKGEGYAMLCDPIGNALTLQSFRITLMRQIPKRSLNNPATSFFLFTLQNV